ncbi:MAG: hypothetical protein ACRYF9_24365 [Janthinobacterium lividum]|uniref:porin n=1 Tax=Pseudomonas sp. MWU16-30317 TaxID=2878095 RepID=UPI001CF9F832|nr:porin [Pseudomonas sp. MWU16-30317]
MRPLAALLLSTVPVLAMANVEVDNALTLRGGEWSGDRSLTSQSDIVTGTAGIRTRLDTESAGQGIFDAWANVQNTSAPRHGLVREAYWRDDVDNLSIKAGRQIIVWGRADGLNPTDNLSPRDFTLLTPVDGDQRYGNTALNLSYEWDVGTLTALWFPQAAAHTIPLTRLANVSYDVQQPDQSQWALKWDMSGDNIDGSVSYFDGVDPMPDLVPGMLTSTGATVKVKAQRTRFWGADMSMTQGGTIWRAETALSETQSSGSDDFRHKKNQLWFVGGGEWRLFDTATLGLQLTYTHVFDYADAHDLAPGFEREVALRQAATSGQTSRDQAGFTWRLADTWFNELLRVEFSGVAQQTSGSGIARLKADYALTDNIKLTAGMDYYYGPKLTFFGQLRDDQTVYTQAEYRF